MARTFAKGAVMLMVSGLIVRLMGFVYRVYLANLIGAEGMGLFQLVFPVYSLIVLTLTSGVSVTVSRMVAAESAKGNKRILGKIVSAAVILTVSAGIAVSVIIALFNGFIVDHIFKDQRTFLSLLILVPTIPIIAASSAIRGYFYGMQNMKPASLSNIIEDAVKILVTIALAQKFAGVRLDLACALATVGTVTGEIASLIVMYIFYIKNKKARKNETAGIDKRKRFIIIDILKSAVPISTTRFIVSFMSSAEALMIPQRLMAGGLDYTSSLSAFGVLAGMAMPLIFFPGLVTSSLSTSLVPAISEAQSAGYKKGRDYKIATSIQITFILGFLFFAMFFTFPGAIGRLIYKEESVGEFLYLLSFCCIFMYMQQTLTGIMNGLNLQNKAFINSVIGNIIRLLGVYFFIPIYGIRGYVVVIIVSSGVICTLNLVNVLIRTRIIFDIKNWILKPMLTAFAIIATAKYIPGLMEYINNCGTIFLAASILVYFLIGGTMMALCCGFSPKRVMHIFTS